MDRRRFLSISAATALSGVSALPAIAATTAPIGALGIDGTQFGLRAGSPDDQSRALQRAVNETARTRTPLALAPGVYRVGDIKLAAGANIVGVRGATRLVFSEGSSLVSANGAEHVTLSGLVLDGAWHRLPAQRGLVHIENVRALRVTDCEIVSAGGNAVHCIAVDGEIAGNTLTNMTEAAIHCLDANGLLIARNSVNGAANNGIQVWRTKASDDGTMIVDNRIENIDNRSGGSGQYGNAINVFRAANVIVRGNRIRNCSFSAVRGNAASNIHIEGNSVSDVREVALYAEFGFEGALIANNTVDGAAIGISVTNFNDGGRLAVVQGNIIRNLLPKRPAGTDADDGAGIGIAVEADTAVSGNVVEYAPYAGITLGTGRWLRDVTATGNVVRMADIGIAVSVSGGAGTALIANNIISGITRGAILGLDGRRIVTGDLMQGGADRYANLAISGNRLR